MRYLYRLGMAVVFSGALAVMPESQHAFASEAPPAADTKPTKRRFNFEGDTISTDYLKPGTMLIEGVSRGRRSSLIDVRLDFVSEILRSADDI